MFQKSGVLNIEGHPKCSNSHPPAGQGPSVSESPSVGVASKFPDIGVLEGFEESFDLDDMEEFKVEFKEVEGKKQCEALVAVPIIQAPLAVVPRREEAMDEETRTTALVMGQMAEKMFSGMLKTLFEAKADKK